MYGRHPTIYDIVVSIDMRLVVSSDQLDTTFSTPVEEVDCNARFSLVIFNIQVLVNSI